MPRKLLHTTLHKIDKQAALKGTAIILLFIFISRAITQMIGEEAIAQAIKDAGIRGPLFLVGRKAFSVIFVPFSGSMTYVLAGGLYGIRKATIYGMLGNALGISVAFWIGRTRGIQAVKRIAGQNHTKEIKHLLSHLTNIKTFTITRIVLFPLEDLLNYASGMSNIPFSYFFVISMIIITILSMVPILLGYAII